MALLQAKHLRKHFPVRSGLFRKNRRFVQAVEDVSLEVEEGETLAVVGESGCGKSTLGRLLLRLVEPTSGSIQFQGEEVLELSSSDLRKWRRKAQIIFQDPLASLSPRMSIREIVGEAFAIHGHVPPEQRDERVRELIEKVGLGPEVLTKRPRELSGGQRQRVGIARALAVEPKFIVCDEPVSALDVSVQGQILNLLMDLQDREKLAYLFISHDLSVVEFVARRVIVMYAGRVMEVLPGSSLRSKAKHPYTQALRSASLSIDESRNTPRLILSGEVPDPAAPPSGCVFHTRCPLVEDRCRLEIPVLREVAPGEKVACHLV